MKNKTPYRIFQKIQPGWDFDLHIHSNWSEDNLKGPSLQDYVPLAENYKIHIGFADHFEMQYYRKYGGAPRLFGSAEWRLNPESLEKYLDEVDNLKEQYPFVTSGLEIDYYTDKKIQLQEFVDDYYDQFDLLIGSVHETEKHEPITILENFNGQIKKYGSFSNLLEKYWSLVFELVEDKIFDVVAHPDVIYRFFDRDEISKSSPEYLNDSRILDLGRLCVETNTLMEVNLSGYFKKWGQSFPKKEFAYNLHANNVKLIIGTDSHTTSDFEKSILKIREYNEILRTRLN